MRLSSSLLSIMKKFKDTGREQLATFRYWISFLDAGDTLMKLLRADRVADFESTLPPSLKSYRTSSWLAAAAMHDLLFIFLPVICCGDRHLEVSVPRMFRHMSEGGFVVIRSERTFNFVTTDQALEQSINREAKSQGGVIGYTLRKGTVVQWLLTRYITGEYAEQFKEMCTPTKSIWHSSYAAEMRHLEVSVPRMFRHISEGGFVVIRPERTFNCVTTDQALEQSINREAKSQGGVIGYTLRKGTVVRWLLTRHITGEYGRTIQRNVYTYPVQEYT